MNWLNHVYGCESIDIAVVIASVIIHNIEKKK